MCTGTHTYMYLWPHLHVVFIKNNQKLLHVSSLCISISTYIFISFFLLGPFHHVLVTCPLVKTMVAVLLRLLQPPSCYTTYMIKSFPWCPAIASEIALVIFSKPSLIFLRTEIFYKSSGWPVDPLSHGKIRNDSIWFFALPNVQ